MRREFDSQSLWLTRLVDGPWADESGINPLGAAIAASFAVVPIALAVWLLRDTIGLYVTGTIALFSLIGIIGPMFVWYYDERLFPNFVDTARSVVGDEAAFVALANRYHSHYRERYWVVAAVWTPLLVVVCLVNMEFFHSIGVEGYADPAFLSFMVGAVWYGILTGIGLYMALIAVAFIHAVGQLELVIDPLHPDGFGGMSAVGMFTIWTTLLISIGSLGFPFAFVIATEGGLGEGVYLVVAVYVMVLLLSFFYPTLYINRRANAVRRRELDERREEIQALTDQILALDEADVDTVDRMATQLDVMKAEFEEYKNVTLYPLSVGVMSRLVSSILLPAFVFAGEVYLSV